MKPLVVTNDSPQRAMLCAQDYLPSTQRQNSYSGISSSTPPLDSGCLVSQIRYCPGGQSVIFLAGSALWFTFAQAVIRAATIVIAKTSRSIPGRNFIFLSRLPAELFINLACWPTTAESRVATRHVADTGAGPAITNHDLTCLARWPGG